MFGRAEKASTIQGQASERDLAGVLGRSRLAVVAAEMLTLAAKTREAVVCTFVEVRGPKNLNQAADDDARHDTRGEDIATAPDALGAVFRRSDVLARWSRNCFVVLSVGPGPESDDVERRMIQRLQLSEEGVSSQQAVRVSAGRVVHMPWQDEDLDQIVERADQEMERRRRLQQVRDGERDFEEL